MKSNDNTKKVNGGKVLFSAVLAMILFFILLSIESNILGKYEKKVVFVASSDIPYGTEITKENAPKLFKMAEVEVARVTKTTVVQGEQLFDMVTTSNITNGEIVSVNDLRSKSDILNAITTPTKIGFKVDEISSSVTGTVRQGDLIDIHVVDSNTGVDELLMSKVYVDSVYDTAGNKVDRTTQGVAVMNINIVIDETMVSDFNSKCAKGKIKINIVDIAK